MRGERGAEVIDFGERRKREVFSVIRFNKISRPKGEGDGRGAPV